MLPIANSAPTRQLATIFYTPMAWNKGPTTMAIIRQMVRIGSRMM
jgi:hypothetical protein